MRLLLSGVMERLFEVEIVEELDFGKISSQDSDAIYHRCEIQGDKHTPIWIGKPSATN
jgi:hypothetical protein